MPLSPLLSAPFWWGTMFSLTVKIFGGSLYENRRGVGPGGFSSGVQWLPAALPTPVSAGSGSKGLSQPVFWGTPGGSQERYSGGSQPQISGEVLAN